MGEHSGLCIGGESFPASNEKTSSRRDPEASERSHSAKKHYWRARKPTRTRFGNKTPPLSFPFDACFFFFGPAQFNCGIVRSIAALHRGIFFEDSRVLNPTAHQILQNRAFFLCRAHIFNTRMLAEIRLHRLTPSLPTITRELISR